jgi:negative regulator of flagellin synthesis FlgM
MRVKDASEVRRVDATRTPESKRTPASAGSAASDKVSTDSKAQLDAAATAARQAAGQNRTIRLEAIEAAVRQGTFRPDPQRIAQRILDDAELTAVLQSMMTRG